MRRITQAVANELLETLEEMLSSYEAEWEICGGWKKLNDKARDIIRIARGNAKPKRILPQNPKTT